MRFVCLLTKLYHLSKKTISGFPYQNPFMYVIVIVCNINVVFETQCMMLL